VSGQTCVVEAAARQLGEDKQQKKPPRMEALARE
jgi:hypothetical protein